MKNNLPVLFRWIVGMQNVSSQLLVFWGSSWLVPIVLNQLASLKLT